MKTKQTLICAVLVAALTLMTAHAQSEQEPDDALYTQMRKCIREHQDQDNLKTVHDCAITQFPAYYSNCTKMHIAIGDDEAGSNVHCSTLPTFVSSINPDFENCLKAAKVAAIKIGVSAPKNVNLASGACSAWAVNNASKDPAFADCVENVASILEKDDDLVVPFVKCGNYAVLHGSKKQGFKNCLQVVKKAAQEMHIDCFEVPSSVCSVGAVVRASKDPAFPTCLESIIPQLGDSVDAENVVELFKNCVEPAVLEASKNPVFKVCLDVRISVDREHGYDLSYSVHKCSHLGALTDGPQHEAVSEPSPSPTIKKSE
jgi:hypothetical protein